MSFDFTVKLAPYPPVRPSLLAAGTALCAAEALGESARIAWPGHILLGGEPACDVTLRAAEGGGELRFAGPLEGGPAFEDAVRQTLPDMVQGVQTDSEALLQRYCARCDTLMKFVDVVYRGMPVYGFAFAVDKHGGLMVMTQESRTVVTVYTGEAVIAEEEDAQV